MSTRRTGVAGRAVAAFAVLALSGIAMNSCAQSSHLQQHSFRSSARIRMQTFLQTELRWTTWNIFEYNDEQSLDYGGNYGPLANVFANPNLGSFSQADYRDTGIIVAVVFIDPSNASVPSGYRKLGLVPDFTCVVMQWTTAGQWRAYAVKSTDRTCPRDAGVPLTVREVGSSTDPKDYPPVARFQITQKRRNIIGVRCLVKWCELGLEADDEVEAPEHAAEPMMATNTQANVPGWHDYQRVGHDKLSIDMDWFPIAVRFKPVLRSSIVPERGLGDWDSTHFTRDTGVLVARIFTRGNPPKKYANVGIRTGWTQLRLRRDSVHGWSARYVAGREMSAWFKVQRTDHHHDLPTGQRIPGTARWRWDEMDEEIWVACDVGCCRVTRDLM